MEINIKQVDEPFFSEFGIFAKPDPELLLKKGILTVEASHKSKTRITTSVSWGSFCAKINWAVEDFNTAEVLEDNLLHDQEELHNYFVISKKQGKQEYYSYLHRCIVKLIKQLGLYDQMDQLMVEIIDKIEWPEIST